MSENDIGIALHLCDILNQITKIFNQILVKITTKKNWSAQPMGFVIADHNIGQFNQYLLNQW